MPVPIKEVIWPKLTPTQQKLRRFLAAAPADQVFTTQEIIKAIYAGIDFITRSGRLPELQPYRLKTAKVVYWGSRKAIAALRKALHDQRR